MVLLNLFFFVFFVLRVGFAGGLKWNLVVVFREMVVVVHVFFGFGGAVDLLASCFKT